MLIRPLPEQSELLQFFSYDSETGRLVRIAKTHRNTVPGRLADTAVSAQGYRLTSFNNRPWLTHRLIWKIVTGDDPPQFIDHVDGNRLNNSWSNLRLADKSENMANRTAPSNNKTGVKGVSYDKQRGQYAVYITKNRKRKFCGRYNDLKEASEAYENAALVIHQEFKNTRKRT